MTLRIKILAISLALLTLLCAALYVSLRLQRSVHDEVAAVTEYHLPINGAIAEIESDVLDYQLNLARLLRIDAEAADAAATEARERALMAEIGAHFAAADALIERAIVDPRNDVSDRLVLARMHGVMQMFRRELAPFEATGQRVFAAWRAGDRDAAHAHLAEFERYERLMGPDLQELRRDIDGLARQSAADIVERQGEAESFSLVLFMLAAGVGFGLAGVLATRLVGGLRRLLAGARAVERGEMGEPLPVTSKDEVGQLTTAFNHMVEELRTKERIKDTFGKFVDPKIVASLMDSRGGYVDGAERRVVTVFFSDIQGFSGLSERLTATVIANLLNRWFTLSTDAIRAHNGVVDKYIGDSVMAFWTPPFSAGDSHAADACLAALAQRDALAALRAELPQILGLRRDVPSLTVRMGLATGEVVLGTIGAPTAKSFTVIGDTVNLAARLEGTNKTYGTTIIASEDTVRLAGGAIETRELDTVGVAGKTESSRIFEVMARAGELTPEAERLRERWSDALVAYRARDWAMADRALAACAAIDPGDRPTDQLRERIAKLSVLPPQGDWDGIWRVAKG